MVGSAAPARPDRRTADLAPAVAFAAEYPGELLAEPDCVLLDGIGHYPQLEAAPRVLEHYLAFRQALAGAGQATTQED